MQLLKQSVNKMQNKKQNNVNVQLTQNTNVKHARFISVMQAQAQNNANAHLYTQAQKAQAQALAQALQAQYVSKNTYTNLRKNFIAVKVASASINSNALIIAKQFNAKVVITKTSVVMRLFA
jgi:hypothetical protein